MSEVFGFLTLALVSFLVHSTRPAESPVESLKLDTFKVFLGDDSLKVFLDNPSHDSLQDEYKTGRKQLLIHLGVQLLSHNINLRNAKYLGENKIGFGEHTTLQLKNVKGEKKCVIIQWKTSDPHQSIKDCFLMSAYHWYGGPASKVQYWPVEESIFKENSYVTKEFNEQALAESYWLNSDGLMIYVDPTVPLFIDQNHYNKLSLCLIAKHDSPYLRKGGPFLKYVMCKFDNPRVAHEYAVKAFLGKPSSIPDTRMVEHPIWSTFGKYKKSIDEGVVMEYAKSINDNGFKNSHIEIDDLWETCYGSLSINKTRFPDMKKLTTELNKMGFRTSIWVHPFISFDCDIYEEASKKGYLVKNTEGNTTMIWWNGFGSYVDFTNPAAAEWFEKRLRNLLAETGIDSLKFDGGESGYAPPIADLNGPELEQPEIITQKYVHLAAKFGSMIEIRTGKCTQYLPAFVRMLDRDSTWSYKGGIRSVLPAVFLLNLSGYPFVLPDTVGGNTYHGDKELFIRYLQMNVFLPAIKFSIPPWDYDKETMELSKKYTALHYKYSDLIISLMKNAVETGQPINTPIWWVDPTNKEAHGIDTEYMLGEDILVAPVLDEGATSLNVYLPKGQWQDESKPDRPIITGPTWLLNQSAPLDTLVYFTRVTSGAQHLSFGILLTMCLSYHLIILIS